MCPFHSLLWPVIYNIGWSCILSHSAVLENIHTYPTKGIWIDNFWNYTSYVSIVTTRPDINYLLKVVINKWECIKIKQKHCIMVHFQCRFHSSDFKQIFLWIFFIQMVKKLNENLFGVQTWCPTIICKFCWTMTDCLQCVSQDFWQTVPKFIWNSRSSLRTWQFH